MPEDDLRVHVRAAAAPPLELPLLDGGTASLADHRDRPVLVSFLRHAG